MGQPPKWGHFTSRVSISITVAAPKSRAPWIDNDQETQLVPARYGRRAAPSHSSGLGSLSWLCAMPVASHQGVCQSPMIRWHVWRDRLVDLDAVASLCVVRRCAFDG